MGNSVTFAMKGSGLKRREFLKFGLAAGTAIGAGSLLGHPLITDAFAQKKKGHITIGIPAPSTKSLHDIAPIFVGLVLIELEFCLNLIHTDSERHDPCQHP